MWSWRALAVISINRNACLPIFLILNQAVGAVVAAAYAYWQI